MLGKLKRLFKGKTLESKRQRIMKDVHDYIEEKHALKEWRPGKDWVHPGVVSSLARVTGGGEGGASEGAVQSVDEVSEEGGGDRVAAWKMHVDAASGTPYWHNADTNETTWERPGSGMDFI